MDKRWYTTSVLLSIVVCTASALAEEGGCLWVPIGTEAADRTVATVEVAGSGEFRVDAIYQGAEGDVWTDSRYVEPGECRIDLTGAVDWGYTVGLDSVQVCFYVVGDDKSRPIAVRLVELAVRKELSRAALRSTDNADGASSEESASPVPGHGVRAWPNPANPEVVLGFRVDHPGPVAVSIFDVRGRRVAMLDRYVDRAQECTIVWNGTTDNGGRAPSGVYFYRVETTNNAFNGKFTFVK